MSIDTYANLQTAIANWSGRSDLTSRAPEFISICEAKINRLLATRDMETTNSSFSITGETVAVPTGFKEVREFYLNSSPRQPISLMPGPSMTGIFKSDTGQPRYYEVIGGNFRFAPIPDATYSATITYSQTISALSGSNTTNWLLTAYPDIYLYGSLLELGNFMMNDQMVQKYQALFNGAVEELKKANALSKWGVGMAVRVA